MNDLYFKDADNRNGDLIIHVPSQINLISFINLLMNRKSTLNVIGQNENIRSIRKLDENEEESSIAKVENSININDKSIVTLSNIFLIGTLNIYDDFSLTMNENSNFSEQSEINIVIQQSKSYSSK